MQTEYYILLGAFKYSEGSDHKHLYGVLYVNTERLDYNVKYIGERQLIELHNANPDLVDFTIKEGLMYWRDVPIDVSEAIALRTKDSSFDMGLKSDSFYNLLWYLVHKDYYFVSDENSFSADRLKNFSLRSLSPFSNMIFPENSLGAHIVYRDRKGVVKSEPLLTMDDGARSFKVLTSDPNVPEQFKDYFIFYKSVNINGKPFYIYDITLSGSITPSMSSLGQYLPNLICFLKAMVLRYRSLLTTIDIAISGAQKDAKVIVDIPTLSLENLTDESIKVNYSLDFNEDVIKLLVGEFLKSKQDLEVGIRTRIKELNEVEKFVILNLMQFKDVTSSSLGYVHLLHTWRETIAELTCFFELMLMIQRSSLTVATPSKIRLSKQGICGLTKGVSEIREG